MKHIVYLLGITCLFFSCNDSFLERYPTHDLNDAAYWKTADDLKAFNNGIYNLAATDNYEFYSAYSNSGSASQTYATYIREIISDNAVGAVQTTWLTYAAGLHTRPASASYANKWNWEFLRRCNIFLQNYHKADIMEETKRNYAGEVYLWRAWFYLDRMQWFGDVPFINQPLEIDSPELYAARDPRTLVADSILADIDRAVEYLPTDWDSNNPDRASKWMALALKSRICLYEGTYRTYHGMSGAEKFLNEAVSAAQEIINSERYTIYSTGDVDKDLWILFNTQDLSSNKEVIWRFTYESPGNISSAGRCRGLYETTYGLTKDLMDDFLCIEADGTAKPIGLSDAYDGSTIESSFDNRDPRMGQTALDPRREFEFVGTGLNNYPGVDGAGNANWKSRTGYHLVKFFNKDERAKSVETDDYPVMRYAEVLLNYAEAKAVLGTITQSDLDISINKLRARVEMPHLMINPVMDPKYAGEGISALMVEIRRERRIELAGENFRYQDLMRWKKGLYMTQPYLGVRVNPEDLLAGGRFEGFTGGLYNIDGINYIDGFYGTSYTTDRRVFYEDKHYLHPIPTNVITKNPNLIQNPRWDED